MNFTGCECCRTVYMPYGSKAESEIKTLFSTQGLEMLLTVSVGGAVKKTTFGINGEENEKAAASTPVSGAQTWTERVLLRLSLIGYAVK